MYNEPTPAGTVDEDDLDIQINTAKEVFLKTEVYKTVKGKLEEFGHVTICGASGEGKTTTALMLGSKYRRNGYKLALVDRIDQFKLGSFLRSSPKVFLIIDDMFGTVGLSPDVFHLKLFLRKLDRHLQICKKQSQKWHSQRNRPAKKEAEHNPKLKRVSNPAEQLIKDIRVVFTSKTYNFQVERDKVRYERFSLFNKQTVVDLTKQKQHRYKPAEKIAMFEKHRNLHKECLSDGGEDGEDFEDVTEPELCDADYVFGYPLTCKLFFELSFCSKYPKMFFKEPLHYLTVDLNSLLKSKSDRSAILVLMLLCEEKLDLTKLEATGKDEALDNMVRTVLDMFPLASRLGMYEAAKSFRGTFFTRGDTVGFAHSSIYDACACVLYDISPTFVLTHCSDNFIYERVQSRPEPETEIDEHLHVIYLSESYYDILTTRLAKSIKDGHFSKSVTHPILQQDKIVLQLLEKLQPDESMEESWFHKRDMEESFLYWTVRGHSSKFAKDIEKKTGEEFTQIEITESFSGCVLRNNLTLLKWLFSRSEHPVVSVTLNSLLLLCAVHGISETLVYILEEGADIFTTDKYEHNIIHLACKSGQHNIILGLIEHGSNFLNDEVKATLMNAQDGAGMTPLMVAAQTGSYKCFQLVQPFSNTNIKNKEGNGLIHLACIGGSVAIVTLVIPHFSINSRGQCGYTPVMTAAASGQERVFNLLESKKANLTLLDDYGYCLLHHACGGGNSAIVQRVLPHFNISCRGCHGRTPVMMAVSFGRQRIFHLLVSKKADLTLLDEFGENLIQQACRGGNTTIVAHLVTTSNINSRSQLGLTPVMIAAYYGHKHVFDLLVSKKANLRLLDNTGDSLLHLACHGGNTAIVQHLVSPSNINTRGDAGLNPVMIAALVGHQSVFDLLASKNADLTLQDDNGDSLLHLACVGGNTAIVQQLVSPSNINTTGRYGWTPVMTAAVAGQERVYDLFVSKNADLTLQDDNGDSLLHLACRGGNTAIIQQLVSPSNINTRGNCGWTPAMIAATFGKQSVFDLFVSKNADLTLQDDNGNSLLHLACNGGNTAIVEHVVSPSNINTRGHYGHTPLMAAAAAGQLRVFDLLVSKNADLTLVDDRGDSLLHLACIGGNTGIVQQLVSPANINTRGAGGWTPVMIAVATGKQSVFDLLVTNKADLTLTDSKGDSLLHLACRGGNTVIVKQLVSPSNINTRGKCGWTPAMTAATFGKQSVYDLFVSKNADLTLQDDNGDSLLHHACRGGNTAIVQQLVSPANINTRGAGGWTPVMIAVATGKQSVFDLLVTNKADLSLLDNKGDSLLHLACQGGNTAIVQHVLSPSNINTRGQCGWTPVMKAAAFERQSVFGFLVSKNADLTLLNNLGDSLLQLACMGGNTAIVQQLVSPSNINTRGSSGWTPVMMAATAGKQSVFDLLVSKKADLKLQDDNGDSLLHLACQGGNTVIVKQLVTSCTINTTGQYGLTPVMTAAVRGHQRVFDFLVSQKADLTLLNNHGDSVLHLACVGGNAAIVQQLVTPSNINTRRSRGWTPVMMAAAAGQKDVFDLLVTNKADLTLTDTNGDSLLHLACRGGNTAIVQQLVSPSNINTRGNCGWTPVMTAATFGKQSVFDLLVSKKADLRLQDDNGDSLLHHACRGGNTTIVQQLMTPSNINMHGQKGYTPVVMAALAGHQNVFDLLVSRNADLTLWIAIVIAKLIVPLMMRKSR